MSGVHPFVQASSAPLNFEAPWFQGRGAYGGLTSAAMLRALRAVVPADRPLRSFSAALVAPASGPARCEAELVRSGRYLSHAAAQLYCGDKPVGRASGAFGGGREHPVHKVDETFPQVKGPALSPPQPFPPGMAPAFTALLEYRNPTGVMPFSGADCDTLSLWVRLRPGLLLDEASLLGLLDCAPPALLVRLRAPRPMATVDLRAQLMVELPLRGASAEDFYLVTTHTRQAHGGYAEEVQSLYSEAGELLARSTQLLALF